MVTPAVQQLWPLLLVREIEVSIAFYCDRLGFSVAGRAEAEGRLFWCRLQRDGVSLMLQQAEEEDGPASGRGRGIVFYFVCDDADVIYAELSLRGLQLKLPTTTNYGMKQIFVDDPDGYSFCFESPADAWNG